MLDVLIVEGGFLASEAVLQLLELVGKSLEGVVGAAEKRVLPLRRSLGVAFVVGLLMAQESGVPLVCSSAERLVVAGGMGQVRLRRCSRLGLSAISSGSRCR